MSTSSSGHHRHLQFNSIRRWTPHSLSLKGNSLFVLDMDRVSLPFGQRCLPITRLGPTTTTSNAITQLWLPINIQLPNPVQSPLFPLQRHTTAERPTIEPPSVVIIIFCQQIHSNVRKSKKSNKNNDNNIVPTDNGLSLSISGSTSTLLILSTHTEYETHVRLIYTLQSHPIQ